VRWGAPPGAVRPRSHLALHVEAEDRVWHADVGFGVGTLLEPLPFGAGAEHEQAGRRFRIVAQGEELVLQDHDGAAWRDHYAFLSAPVPLVDVETSNWFTGTHPRSPFVSGLVASALGPDGTRTMLSDWSGELLLTSEAPLGSSAQTVARERIPSLLAEGFALDAEGRVRTAG